MFLVYQRAALIVLFVTSASQGPSDLISLILHKCDTSGNKKRLLSLMDNSGYQALHLAAGHSEDVVIIRSFIGEAHRQ